MNKKRLISFFFPLLFRSGILLIFPLFSEKSYWRKYCISTASGIATHCHKSRKKNHCIEPKFLQAICGFPYTGKCWKFSTENTNKSVKRHSWASETKVFRSLPKTERAVRSQGPIRQLNNPNGHCSSWQCPSYSLKCCDSVIKVTPNCWICSGQCKGHWNNQKVLETALPWGHYCKAPQSINPFALNCLGFS